MPAERVCVELAREPLVARSFEDPARGYRGFLVIDSLCGGRANGGVRIRPGLTLEELRAAARVMTWKYRFAGVPNGGAKAGVEGDEGLPRPEKARRLAWLADRTSQWIDGGVLGIGPDMGSDSSLIEELLEQRGLLRGRRRFPARFRGSGFYTALSVVEAAEAALGSRGQSLRGARVAVEGFGAVGSQAAQLLVQRGARVVAVSTREGALHCEAGLDVPALCRSEDPLASDPRARRIPSPELLRLPVDCLLPCGPGGTLDGEATDALQAPVVVPGANHAASFASALALHQRGCLLVPCFVANCGGVTAASLRIARVPERAIVHLLCHVLPRRVAELLEEARRAGRAPLEQALATLPPLPDPGEDHRGLAGPRLRRLFRSPWLPGALWAAPAYLYFARRLGRRISAAHS